MSEGLKMDLALNSHKDAVLKLQNIQDDIRMVSGDEGAIRVGKILDNLLNGVITEVEAIQAANEELRKVS